MFPPPPNLAKILHGLHYGLRVATAQIKAGDEADHPQDVPAIWDALWAHWLISLVIGVPMLGLWAVPSALLSFAVLSLLITMLYPLASYYAVQGFGLSHRYPPFIITMTWLNNFREVFALVLFVSVNILPTSAILFVLAPVAIWILWAFWRGATQSLGASGWVGFLMLVLLLTVQMFAYALASGMPSGVVSP